MIYSAEWVLFAAFGDAQSEARFTAFGDACWSGLTVRMRQDRRDRRDDPPRSPERTNFCGKYNKKCKAKSAEVKAKSAKVIKQNQSKS